MCQSYMRVNSSHFKFINFIICLYFPSFIPSPMIRFQFSLYAPFHFINEIFQHFQITLKIMIAERNKKFQFRTKNSENKISDWIHFKAQIFGLNSFQSTKFQSEVISEHKISDWIHFRAQNFKLKSFQNTKFKIEFISEHKISD